MDTSKIISEERARALFASVLKEKCDTRTKLEQFADSHNGPKDEIDFLKDQVFPYLNQHRTFGIGPFDVQEILEAIYRPRQVA